MTRLNKVLIGLAAAQLVLAFFVATRSGGSVELAQTPVLAGFDAAQVTRLQVFENGPDKGIDLVKKGSDWVLASQWDYPVDPAKVEAALAPLAKLTAGDPLATSAVKHRQLGVADNDFEKKLVITAGGKDTTLFVGATRSRRTALRVGGDDRVLGASGVPVGALSSVPRDWVFPSYSDIPRDDIDKIEIVRGATKIELDRTVATPAAGSGSGSGSDSAAPPRTWRLAIDGAPVALAGETLDIYMIDTIVSDVAQISAEPADPKLDASKPAATITATRKDGKTVVFDVVENGPTYWIKQRGVERATQIDKSRFESVMAADRSKLVQKPETPKPGAGSGGPTAPIVPPP